MKTQTQRDVLALTHARAGITSHYRKCLSLVRATAATAAPSHNPTIHPLSAAGRPTVRIHNLRVLLQVSRQLFIVGAGQIYSGI